MTLAEVFCVIVPVFICLQLGGSVFFLWKIKENGIFVLGVINGIIMPKTNKF